MSDIAVVILAAGKGTRMKDLSKPKVLFEVNGKPMLEYIINVSNSLHPTKIIPIVGYMKELVIAFCSQKFGFIEQFAHQDEQLGTGHAVLQAEEVLKDFDGSVLILAGDVPLITLATLEKFKEAHFSNDSVCSVLSTKAANPFAYGRIIRDVNGEFLRITEEKDASDEEKLINEINSGIFFVQSKPLLGALKQIKTNNAQSEFYLTDIIEILRKDGKAVNAFCEADFEELQGINSKEDLTRVENLMKSMP